MKPELFFVYGMFFTIGIYLFFCFIRAFFDGWDNKVKQNSKLYYKIYNLGNILYLRKSVKNKVNDPVDQVLPNELLDSDTVQELLKMLTKK